MTDRHHLLVHGGTFAAVGDRGDISGYRAAAPRTACSYGTHGISAGGSSPWTEPCPRR